VWWHFHLRPPCSWPQPPPRPSPLQTRELQLRTTHNTRRRKMFVGLTCCAVAFPKQNRHVPAAAGPTQVVHGADSHHSNQSHQQTRKRTCLKEAKIQSVHEGTPPPGPATASQRHQLTRPITVGREPNKSAPPFCSRSHKDQTAPHCLSLDPFSLFKSSLRTDLVCASAFVLLGPSSNPPSPPPTKLSPLAGLDRLTSSAPCT
jgi:hypothetical protein